MWPAIVIGGGLSYAFSRLLAGDGPPQYPPQQMQMGARPGGPPPPPQPPRIDAHIEPSTRAGLERLLMGGTPEQLDQAAFSLLRSGYPLAAEVCAKKAIAMRQFDEQRKAATARREQMMAQAQQSAEALAAQNAQAEAVAQAATRMHALAEKAPQVALPLAPQPVTVAAAPLPGAVAFAPPIGAVPGGVPLPAKRRGRGPAKKRVVEGLNGHGPEASPPDVTSFAGDTLPPERAGSDH